MKLHTTFITVMIIAFIFITGCNVGAHYKNFHVANNPSGDRIVVFLKGQSTRYSGELLSVDDNSIHILTNQHGMVQIYYTRARRMMVGKNKFLMSNSSIPTRKTIEKFRVYGRYPQGMNDELKSSMLTSYQLDEVLIFY